MIGSYQKACEEFDPVLRDAVRTYLETDGPFELASSEKVQAVIGVLAGLLVEFFARLKTPEVSVRDACIDMIDVFIDENAAELADITGQSQARN